MVRDMTEEQTYRNVLESAMKSYREVYQINLDEDIYQLVYVDSDAAYEDGTYSELVARRVLFGYIPQEEKEELQRFLSAENIVAKSTDKNAAMTKRYRKYVDGKYHNMLIHIIMNRRTEGEPRTATMMIEDIEDEIRKEEEQNEVLKHALFEAQEASVAKSAFLSNISHDIRMPLNAILGIVNLAKQEELSDKMSEYLEYICISGRHLLWLLNGIIEMAQIESGKFPMLERSFSMETLLKDICLLLQPELARRGHTLQFSAEGISKTHVLGDDRQLGKVLLNVLENAVKYTPDGGKIQFEVYAKNCPISGKLYFEFLIKDDGIGIDEESLGKIFLPFERGKEAKNVQGSGLGLSIAKEIVERMNGDIRVESRPGAGTQVKIALSLKTTAGPERAVEKPILPLSELAGAGKRILLVEDHVMNRRIAGELIEACGAEVTTAENGERAVEILRTNWARKKRFDIIFMDVQLPGQNGYETTRAIRKMEAEYAVELDEKTIPIIAMTANVFAEDIQRALEAGMNDFLEKPIEVEALAGVLAKWLNI